MANQPKWKFIANLGDASPVEHGGLFLYFDETETHGYEMEKLEEPADDDRCETCENEPDGERSDEIDAAYDAQEKALDAWDDANPDLPDISAERLAILDEHRLLILAAQEKAKAEHAAWKAHVDKHERWTVYRVCLDRQKIVMVDDRRYVVPIAYHDGWSHPIASYVEWFMEDLEDVAESIGVDKEEMISDLCSDDGTKLANAYRAIFDYHGWVNGDGYPLSLSLTDVEARYTDGEL